MSYTEIEALAPVFKKSASELKLKSKPKLLSHIATLNVRTLNRRGQFTGLTAEHYIDIVCLQEHRSKSYASVVLDDSERTRNKKYDDTSNVLTFVAASA